MVVGGGLTVLMRDDREVEGEKDTDCCLTVDTLGEIDECTALAEGGCVEWRVVKAGEKGVKGKVACLSGDNVDIVPGPCVVCTTGNVLLEVSNDVWVQRILKVKLEPVSL